MKKVLIITYYWPPAGGPGVQRVVKFAKYLPQFGWQPVILTVKNPVSPAIDPSLLKSIPKECIVYKTKALQPFSFYKAFTGKSKSSNIPKDVITKKEGESFKDSLARWIRANFFVPDARIGWIPYIVREGLNIIKKENIQAIFSTSPPHSLQLGAKKLAAKSKIKWIADFRDPWYEAYWESDIKKSAVSSHLNKYFEKSIIRHCDLFTTVSAGIAETFFEKYKTPYKVLYNGFDEINTREIETERFNIIFIGNLSKFQDPGPFLRALSQIPDDIRSQIEISFIGNVFMDFRPVFNDTGVKMLDYMPYKELMQFAGKASLLLLIFHETSYSLGYMTAKIFDYLALRKPILAIGKKNSIGEKVLKETESGELFEANETQSIKDFVLKTFYTWKEKKSILLESNKNLNLYQTQHNVELLTKLFEAN